jgi:hypothetical protein
MNVTAGAPDLPELRDYIRQRRAALASSMEQGTTTHDRPALKYFGEFARPKFPRRITP